MKKTSSAIVLSSLIVSVSVYAIDWPTPPTGEIQGGLLGNLISPDTGNGRIGIGTTSPEADLHVQNTTGTGFILARGSSGNDAVLGLDADNTNANRGVLMRQHGATGNLGLRNAISGPLHMVIDANGNVGIGETSPDAKLEVLTTDWNNGIRIQSNQAARLNLLSNAASGKQYIIGSENNGDLYPPKISV